jgi:CcmD family protein
MKTIRKYLLLLFAAFSVVTAQAQSQVEMADVMRSEGKIYVVVGVILIVLVGLFIYLFTLDRKVKKLEDRISSKD